MRGITLILFIYGSRWHRYALREGGDRNQGRDVASQLELKTERYDRKQAKVHN